MKANIVWAAGASWLQWAQLSHLTNHESHLIYYARARALGLDHRVPFDHPDLDLVEEMGVLAAYLLADGSVSR